MKALIIIFSIACGSLHGDDPFSFAPDKHAADLGHCANGHKTLKDVPIVYGHVGGLMSSPEVAAQVKRGEVIPGGCIAGPRDHWVVCTTCRLRYDDEYSAWIEDHSPRPFEPQGERNPPCNSKTVRKVISKHLQTFPLEFGGEKPYLISCSRLIADDGLVGEAIDLWMKGKDQKIVPTLEGWLSKKAGDTSKPDESYPKTKIWEWATNEGAFRLSVRGLGEEDVWVVVEWHGPGKTTGLNGDAHRPDAKQSPPKTNQ